MMTETKPEIRRLNTEGLCNLISEGSVEVGDHFKVTGGYLGLKGVTTEEIVYNVSDSRSADTMIVKVGGFSAVREGSLPLVLEKRYFASGNKYSIDLEATELDTKPYHELIPEEYRK